MAAPRTSFSTPSGTGPNFCDNCRSRIFASVPSVASFRPSFQPAFRPFLTPSAMNSCAALEVMAASLSGIATRKALDRSLRDTGIYLLHEPVAARLLLDWFVACLWFAKAATDQQERARGSQHEGQHSVRALTKRCPRCASPR